MHRDIKPNNLLITAQGTPKLLDFGIAKLLAPEELGITVPAATVDGSKLFTPDYAAPEQIRGQQITTATDVYALGVLLYRLLTGCSPYRQRSGETLSMLRAICEDEPVRPSAAVTQAPLSGASADPGLPVPARLRPLLGGDLDNILLTALAKEPGRRYGSVTELRDDLVRYMHARPIRARPRTARYVALKFVGRHRWGLVASTVASLAIVGGAISTAWQAHVAETQRAQAERRFNEMRGLVRQVLFSYHDAIAALPGSLPVRQRLVNDALAYLDKLAADSGGSPDLEEELAAAYMKMAEIQGGFRVSNIGHGGAALDSLEKALAIRARLQHEQPGNPLRAVASAETQLRLAGQYLSKGRTEAALTAANNALELAESARKQLPDDVGTLKLVIGAHQFRGLLLMRHLPRLDEGVADLRRGAALIDTLGTLKIEKEDLMVARAYAIAYLASTKVVSQHWREAYRKNLEQSEIKEQIVNGEPTSVLAALDLEDAYYRLEYAARALGDTKLAMHHLSRARELIAAAQLTPGLPGPLLRCHFRN